MASKKDQKSKPVRTNDYTPKAGHKKPGTKRRRPGAAVNRNELPLMERVRMDQVAEYVENKLATSSRPLNISAQQVELAMQILEAGNNAIRVVATQIIENFLVAKAIPSENISRTQAAILMLDDQLTKHQLGNKNAMAGGKQAARTALIAAYHQVQASLAKTPQASELVSA